MIIDVLTFTITYYQFKSNKFNMFNRASAIGYRYTYFTRCSGMGTVRKGVVRYGHATGTMIICVHLVTGRGSHSPLKEGHIRP